MSSRPRIGNTHVRHDSRGVSHARRENGSEAPFEQGIVTLGGIAHSGEMAESERPLGDALENEKVEPTAFRQIDRWINAVSAKTGPAADPKRGCCPHPAFLFVPGVSTGTVLLQLAARPVIPASSHLLRRETPSVSVTRGSHWSTSQAACLERSSRSWAVDFAVRASIT